MTKKTQKNLISPAAFARLKGVSRQRVHTLVKDGIIKTIDGKIDPKAADKAIADYADPAKSKKLTPKAENFQKARAVKEFYLAQLRKLEYEKATGLLVEAEQVKREAHQAGRQVRDALMNLPDRIAPVLAAETNPRKVYELLSKELRQALSSLCK